jgi:hypothetical protein
MWKVLRAAALVVLVLVLPFGGRAWAEPVVDNSGGDARNAHEGDVESSTSQDSGGGSGDAVAGQVGGYVSSGDTKADATNASRDVDVESGDADADATASGFTGLNASSGTAITAADVQNIGTANNVQDGDDSWNASQTLTATTGDAIGGQVIGVVTAAGGSTDIVASNTSEDVSVETGDADVDADAAGFGGLNDNSSTTAISASGVKDVATATNVQNRSSRASVSQTADASTGDGVGGQVIGAVTGGDASIDATNSSTDVDIETGDAESDQSGAAFGGLNSSGDLTSVVAASVSNVGSGVNVQRERNSASVKQMATVASGDAVGGQVAGVVTSAGGTADVVIANTSDDVDLETGDATSDQSGASFAGLNSSATDTVVVAAGQTVGNVNAVNAILGDNRSSVSQTSTATTGDAVGGQILGVVSAGDTSVDLTNSSTDVDVETGDADTDADFAGFAGLNASTGSPVVVAAGNDVTNVVAKNIQLGRSMGKEFGNWIKTSQTTTASSGDGVGGQVAGIVTAAGGSADVVGANTSEDVDASTGDATAETDQAAFAGLNDSEGSFGPFVFTAGDTIGNASGTNVQLGDNMVNASQDATASTGDAVGGQVLGVVSAGDTSVDATNASRDVDVSTGDADALATSVAFVGLNSATTTTVGSAGDDAGVLAALNVLNGDNVLELTQTLVATSGDAVGGQVAGVVTAAGGSVDSVLANTSEDVSAETGDSETAADDAAFVGLNAGGTITLF